VTRTTMINGELGFLLLLFIVILAWRSLPNKTFQPIPLEPVLVEGSVTKWISCGPVMKSDRCAETRLFKAEFAIESGAAGMPPGDSIVLKLPLTRIHPGCSAARPDDVVLSADGGKTKLWLRGNSDGTFTPRDDTVAYPTPKCSWWRQLRW
jgi:hypothetical protein